MTPVTLPPEAASWFGTPVPSGAVVVGGVAGGVGTTTVARLLAAGLERWRTGPGTLTVLDAGREPWLGPLPAMPVVAHVVVCGADAAGLRAAADGLTALGAGGVVVPVPVTGPGTPPGRLRRQAAEHAPWAAVVPLPRGRALAAGGPAPTGAGAADVLRDAGLARRVAALVAEVLRAASA